MNDILDLLKKMFAIVGHSQAEQETLASQLLAAIFGKAVGDLLATLPLETRTEVEQNFQTNQNPLGKLNETFGEEKLQFTVTVTSNELIQRYLNSVKDKLTVLQKEKLNSLFKKYARNFTW